MTRILLPSLRAQRRNPAIVNSQNKAPRAAWRLFGVIDRSIASARSQRRHRESQRPRPRRDWRPPGLAPSATWISTSAPRARWSMAGRRVRAHACFRNRRSRLWFSCRRRRPPSLRAERSNLGVVNSQNRAPPAALRPIQRPSRRLGCFAPLAMTASLSRATRRHRRSAFSTFVDGRPSRSSPCLLSKSAIASFVFLPTAPSGSPTS
jgi:hypothetical protein